MMRHSTVPALQVNTCPESVSKETERQRDKETARERKREGERTCVTVCVPWF